MTDPQTLDPLLAASSPDFRRLLGQETWRQVNAQAAKMQSHKPSQMKQYEAPFRQNSR